MHFKHIIRIDHLLLCTGFGHKHLINGHLFPGSEPGSILTIFVFHFKPRIGRLEWANDYLSVRLCMVMLPIWPVTLNATRSAMKTSSIFYSIQGLKIMSVGVLIRRASWVVPVLSLHQRYIERSTALSYHPFERLPEFEIQALAAT